MRKGYDIRLEAATAKEWGSTWSWDMIDEAMQISGGRGYETEQSLAGRGEEALASNAPCAMRGLTASEGSSESCICSYSKSWWTST